MGNEQLLKVILRKEKRKTVSMHFKKKALQSVSIVFFLFSKHKNYNFRIIINLICVHYAKASYKFELEDISQETDIH